MDSPFGFEAIPACWKFSVLTAQGFDDRTPCEGRSKDRPAQYSELTGSGGGGAGGAGGTDMKGSSWARLRAGREAASGSNGV